MWCQSANVSESVHSRSMGIIPWTEDGCSIQKAGRIRFVSLGKKTCRLKELVVRQIKRVGCEIKVHNGLRPKKL